MDWLIVGLGNPGVRYENTRHNAGFMVAEKLAEISKYNWTEQKRFEAFVAGDGHKLIVKPETYMNNSGVCVAKVANYYRIKSDRIIIVHDDLDLGLGSAKVSWAKGPHIHNGLVSVEESLGTKDFWRVRLGVDNRTTEERRVLTGERFVLKSLDYEEKKMLIKGVERGVEIVEDIMKGRYGVN